MKVPVKKSCTTNTKLAWANIELWINQCLLLAAKKAKGVVPMATATYPGKPSLSQYTVELHIGQKRRY